MTVADIPKAAIDAVSEAIGLDEFDARDALEAAAPILAEAWGVTGKRKKPGGTRDPRARIPCRRCGAQPGQQCVTSAGTRAPMVHAERSNDWRRAEGQAAGMMEAEGTQMDRFPPPEEVPGA